MSKSPKLITLAALVAATLGGAATATAWADEVEKSIFSLSGFGTIGISHSDQRQADFTSNPLKFSGAGFNSNWSFDVDSRVGLQLTANFTKKLTGVIQVISEQRYDNTYTPIVEWANLKYQLTPDFSVRAGRIALPIFLAADYRKVGYAIPWARTAVEVYSAVPVSNSDGVDLSYRFHSGDLTNTVQGFYGKTELNFSTDSKGYGKQLFGITNTSEFGATSIRFSYLRGNITVDASRPLFNAVRLFGPQGNALADKYDADSKRATFIGIGGTYDPGQWFLTGEWGRLKTNSFLGDKTVWSASSGYRIHHFTPYIAYAQVSADSNRSDPGLSLVGLPPYLAGPAAGLNAALNQVLGSIAVQKTISVGTRWDFHKNMALKVQYDFLKQGDGSQGTLINAQPGFRPGDTAHVFSAVLDFVF